MNTAFYLPMVGLATLTLVVWAMAVQRRVREIRVRRIPLQSLAHARDVATAFEDCQAMDNFNNLLQVPVLFYAVCLVLAQTGEDSLLFVAGAWAFVLLRVVHSAIQLNANRVAQRFYAWMASTLLLFGLWAGLAVQLLSNA
jgi:hypothetical protein